MTTALPSVTASYIETYRSGDGVLYARHGLMHPTIEDELYRQLVAEGWVHPLDLNPALEAITVIDGVTFVEFPLVPAAGVSIPSQRGDR